MSFLIRTHVGAFKLEDAFTTEEIGLLPHMALLSIDFPIKHLPKYVISDEEAVMIKQGKQIAVKEDEEGLKFTWSVENIGDYSVSFDKNMIAQIVLNGENYAFETESVTLEPGEAYSVDISIPYPVARQDGTNNVKITATTGDTTATYKESFTH